MKTFRQRSANLLGLTSIACMVVQPVYAGSSWLSSVTMIDNATGSVLSQNTPLEGLKAGTTSATAVFNLSISLEEDPQGDDEYPEEPAAAADDDQQNKFEKKIEEFADAVFQATNGKHKIGTVTMFRKGAQANNADVQWKHRCVDADAATTAPGPRANPSGFGVAGKRIYFCTEWEGAPGLMDTPKGAGFTLAHEWAHYAYGLYDEYIANCGQTPETNCVIYFPRSTDTASVPSIMNNQWGAVSGSQDNLEFSTDDVEPYKSSTGKDGDDKTAQARTFSENGWKTLTRDPATDPRHAFLPARTRYSNLVAPAGPDFTVNDSETDARSELDIVWAGNQVAELMIDTSGSMSGTPIANARTAGSLLVSTLSPGKNAVGVGSFASSALQVFPITDIPDPDTGIRAAAQAAINALGANGGTNIEAAALTALAQVQGFQGGQRPSVVFLLTDGQSSVNQGNVISAYTAAKVPLITFGFGPNVDTALLQNLANGTGGSYFFSPTSLAAIQQAFVAANAAFSSSVVVNSATTSAAASATEVRPVLFDSTLAEATINVTYPAPQNEVALRLLNSTGADTGVAFTCTAGAEVSCEAPVDITALGAGQYGLEIVNSGAAAKDVSMLISGTPSSFENYDIAVEFNNANYPASFTIEAAVSKGATLSGLTVVAKVTKPDSSVIDVALLDDGLNADLDADDGIYTAELAYDQNGTYTAVVNATNPTGAAQTTFNGLAISVLEDGSGSVPRPQAVTENFSRVAVSNAQVTNFQADDHTNDPTVPGACTSITDDNTDTAGRIDSAGDIDCFFFVPTSTAGDLVARLTSLGQDLEPIVKIFNAAGTTQLLSVDLSSSTNAASGAVVTIPAASLNAAGHVVTVQSKDPAATRGTYAASIGRPLGSDTPVTVTPVGGGDSGGAMSPWSIFVAALLALFGLRQRRRFL